MYGLKMVIFAFKNCHISTQEMIFNSLIIVKKFPIHVYLNCFGVSCEKVMKILMV